MTIQFHFDNLKLSRMEWTALNNVVRKFWDLAINFGKKNQVHFTMYDYIEDIISTTPLEMNWTTPDLDRAGLFTVDKSSPLLNTDRENFFHSMTARLLFATKQARSNIQVTAH